MHIGFNHYQKNKGNKNVSRGLEKMNKFVDSFIYMIGSLGVIIFVPQLIKVWSPGDISGVSLISWAGMFGASTLWLFYGLLHKARPIIFVNALGGSVQLLIIIGILIHK